MPSPSSPAKRPLTLLAACHILTIEHKFFPSGNASPTPPYHTAPHPYTTKDPNRGKGKVPVT